MAVRLVFTAAPGSGALPMDLVERTAARLAARLRVLDPDCAAELTTEADVSDALCAELRAEGPFDVNRIADPAGVKKLLVADMDATMVAEETLDELARFADVKDQVSSITARAMAGELDFEAALEARVALLKGLAVSALDTVADALTLNPGARTLVATMKAHGARCVLATGGFVEIARRVAELCGFDAVAANRFAIEDGRLTGRLDGSVRGPAAKYETLMEEASPLGGPSVAIAVGDGANDALMLKAAGMGVAYRAKPAAKAAAGLMADHGDLTALLHLQGLARDAFVPHAAPG